MKASITVIIIILLTLLHFSCKYDTGNTKNLKPEIDSLPDAQYESRAFTINIASPLPLYDSKHSFGDSILFKAEIQDTVRFDSICLFIDGKRIYVSGRSPFIYKWCSKRSRVGRHQYSTAVFSKGNKVSKSGNFILVSDIIPQNKSYKIIKSYQHDKSAYTQGLVYDNGILYEGTGQYGESAIRKIKIETGELIQSYTLPQNVFGEGIVVDKNRIIQLTWQSRIAYVFDKESFNFINKYTFQTQGWGITNYPGDNIRKSCFILSDGTSTLYFIEPELFTEIDRFEVYDDFGPLKNLNELEYIKGKVYANVWQTAKIVEIEPETGRVTGIIDLSRLVPAEYINDNDNVLNGIAYNEMTGHVYITGKRWPVLYEIEILE